MLNLRVVQPTTLIDISALAELRRAGVDGDEIVLGACVTHADIEDGRAGSELGALARIAGGIAYRAVRNRGTIGGSLCHADPAADWVTALPALGAVAVIRGLRGERRLPVEDFIAGALTTVLGPSELLVQVRAPRPHPQSLFGYAKSCRKVGEFSKASAAILLDPHAMAGRVVLGALDGAPRVESAESLLIQPAAAGAAASHRSGRRRRRVDRGRRRRSRAPPHSCDDPRARRSGWRRDDCSPLPSMAARAKSRWRRASVSPTCCARPAA